MLSVACFLVGKSKQKHDVQRTNYTIDYTAT